MRYKSLFYNIPEVMFTVDLNMRITSVTRLFKLLVNRRSDRIVGKYCKELFKSPLCGNGCKLKQIMENSNRLPDLWNIEYVSIDGGKKEPVIMNVAAILDIKGNAVGGIGSFRSIRYKDEEKTFEFNENSFEGIVSQNRKMHAIFEKIKNYAKSDQNVLILGKTGTGKNLVAKAIHNLSSRSGKPLSIIEINTIPETLIESELFGHKKGAFTGAYADRIGRFETADGSTVLIDEIGDLPLHLQTKLLRVIEEKVVLPIGSNKPRKVDVRVITATNKNLAKMVEEGTFREDLFYRLNGSVIELPTITERKEDIGLLVRYFIRELNKKSNRKVQITPEVMKIFESRDYPGNVRELENLVTSAYMACKGTTINLSHLPEELSNTDDLSVIGKNHNKLRTLDEYEKEHILEALIVKNWDIEHTAMLLGVQKRTLYRKITKHGLLSLKIN